MVCALLKRTVTRLLIAVLLRCQFYIIAPPAIKLILHTRLVKSQALCVIGKISLPNISSLSQFYWVE